MILALLILAADPYWTPVDTPVQARLRGISAVTSRVVWASGSQGTILRTTNAGATWTLLRVPGAENLDFRDIDAIDDRTAYALSIGPGEASRIYKTTDAGATWQTQFVNRDPRAFFDAMAFSSARRGFAFSDAVDGRHILLRTDDGATWHPVENLPPALPNEGAFAASGTNIALRGRHIWIGTNAGRVLHSPDDGRTWTAAATGLAVSPTAGIFSIAFRSQRHGIVVGGDFRQESRAEKNAARTSDGGRTWRPVAGLTGFRSVVAFLGRRQWIAIGPTGSDFSTDDGQTWRPLQGGGFHTFSYPWAAGENGRAGRLGKLSRRVLFFGPR